MSEIERVAEQDKVTRNELIYRATKTYIRERNIRQNRESMRRGYMEMAKINLNISSEAQYAEFEAENTVERLVSGVKHLIVKRGDVYFADLSPVVGSEQGGVRPVLVIQNDIGNRFSPTAIVAAITAQIQKRNYRLTSKLMQSDTALNEILSFFWNRFVRSINKD